MKQAALFSLLISLLTSLAAQHVLRVENYSVVVDVVVTDKKNRYITDLSKEDFLILEDGVPQEIFSFYPVHPERPESSSHPVSAPAAPGAVVPTAPPRINPIIFLLDYATTEFTNQGYVREAALEYVKERIGPNDLVAVFQVGMSMKFLQNFTNDKEQLMQALSTLNLAGSVYAGDQETLSGFTESAQTQVATLTSSIEALSGAGAPATPAIGAALEILQQQMELAQRLENQYYAAQSFSREQQSRPVIRALETIAAGVQQIPGRKTLILFSQGFSVPLTLERAFYRAVDKANKSNLAIYAIDSGGLQVKGVSTEGELYDISALRPGDRVRASGGITQFDRAREIGSDQKDSTLRYLAAATGGLLIRHTNDLLSALERIDEEVRSHYILTYQPKNLNFDGEFRSLQVRVKPEALKVRARSGYWAIPPGAALLSPAEFKDLLQATRGFDPSRRDSLSSFPLYLQPSYFLGPDFRYQVHVTLEIPTQALQKESAGDGVRMLCEAVGIVQSEGGEIVTSFRGPASVMLSHQQFLAARRLRLETLLSLPPGRYSIAVLAQDSTGGRSSFVQRSLLLPSLAEDLSVSSLVLGKEVEAVNSSAGDLLSVDAIHVFPSAERVFGKEDKLVYYLVVYNPGRGPNGESQVEVVLTLLRKGQEIGRLVSRSTQEPETGPPLQLRFSRYLTLENLSPGTYVLRATVSDRLRENTQITQTHFRVR